MALAAKLTVIGSTAATPKQFTAQSPCLTPYQLVSTMVSYGDYTDTTPPQNAAGITAHGYVNVQYHTNNQWTTATLYTSQSGSEINTLVIT